MDEVTGSTTLALCRIDPCPKTINNTQLSAAGPESHGARFSIAKWNCLGAGPHRWELLV
jgi:hypothetical protein